MSGDTEPMAVTVGRMYRPDLARVQPKTVNEEARTVEVVWTTGARVRPRASGRAKSTMRS